VSAGNGRFSSPHTRYAKKWQYISPISFKTIKTPSSILISTPFSLQA
jgi:hypothetical protein